jgi:hypothetical protein
VTSQYTLNFEDLDGKVIAVTFALMADGMIASVRSSAGQAVGRPLFMTSTAVSRVINYMRDLLARTGSGQHTLRCVGPDKKPVLVAFATMPNGTIAVRRSTGGDSLFMAPHTIPRMIGYLRDLQRQALQGKTWNVG